MTAYRRLTALPLPLLRTTRRLTSSRLSPSGKSLPSSPLVLAASRRSAPLPLLLLVGLAVLLALLPISSSVQAQTPPNEDATGRPRVLASAEGAGILFADTEAIADGNGLPIDTSNTFVIFNWTYQWIRVDGMTETNVGADSASYQPVEADVGKLIKVEVSFTDGDAYSETVTSLPFGPIVQPASTLSPSTLVSNTGQTPSSTANITQRYAMGFRLGDHGQGYEISSVSIDLAAAPSSLTVSLWSGGVPGALQPNSAYKLFDFANPSPFAAGLNEFTAPAGAFAYPNVNYFVVLSGFGSSLSINETTSDNEDAGGETGAVIYDDAAVRALSDTGYWAISDDRAGVLRMAVEGSRRTSGILASTYAQPLRELVGVDQEIISVGDNISYGIELGAADRYLIRGVSWNMDDTDPDGSGFTNPYDLRSGSRTGAKQFTLVNSRKAPGLPVWTAPQGATVTGSGKYVLDQPVGEDTGPEKTRRRDAVLTRAAGAASKVVDGPAAAGVRFTGGIGDIALDNPLMALLGDPLYAMVQNLGQTGSGIPFSAGGNSAVAAQGFTTGPNAAGYRLQGIGVNIEGSDNTQGDPTVPDDAASVSVAVYSADADGKPDAKLFDLVSPSDYAAASLSFFEAPPGTMLDPDTTYVLVWTHLGGTSHRLETTADDSEDSRALSGFSIANNLYVGADVANLPSSRTNVLKIAVYTNRDLSPPKRVTAFDLVSNNSAPRGVWGNEETIWVANDGSGATDKLYAYNRSDRSRDSSSDFDTLNTPGNNNPRGICSDGTTMFVADGGDDKIYAYKMSDTTRDSGKDVTLDSANNSPQGLSCDRTHLWVAEDNDDLTSKIFVYLRSNGSHVSTLDIGASTLSPSSTVGAINNNDQRGMWSNGTTLFVVDDGDDQVYGYQLSDRTRDDDKNLDLDAANTDPWGLWFDGRVLWVADTAADKLYVYDLPGAQPGNTPADGVPEVRTPSEQVWSATLTAATSPVGVGYSANLNPTLGTVSPSDTFILGGVTYTIRGLLITNLGNLRVATDQRIPQDFSLSIAGTSYTSTDASETAQPNGYAYIWQNPGISWSAGETIAIVLSVGDQPTDGVELTADTSDITDDTDGLENVYYHYQWIRVDGTDVTELAGETGPTYTATADDVTKDIQVRVIFDDAFRYREYPRYSPQVTVREVPPVVTGVTLTSDPNADGRTGNDDTYAIGDSVTATVTFDKAVDVTAGPQITLLFDTEEKAADCAAATNTTTMECSYEVEANDKAPNGIEIKANTLALNSGTIYETGSTTNAATLTHSLLSLQSGHKVDGIRPALVTTVNDSPRTSGDGTKVILTFREDIGAVTRSLITIEGNSVALPTNADSISGPTVELTLTTALTDSTTSLTVALVIGAVTDAVGNDNAAITATTVLNQLNAAPSAPTGLTAEPAPDKTPQLAVDLSWTAPNSDGGSAITSHQYRYNRNSGSFGTWTTIANSAAGGANATSFTVEGLSAVNNALTTFEFEVRAINANGNGAESDPATATIDVPDNIALSMATVGNRQVTLTWSTPNNNGSAILRYQYWVYDNVTETFVVPENTTIPNSDADTTSFTITGLTNGVTYTVVIKAVNTVGAPDDDPGSYTPMAGPPGKPSVTVQSRVAALYVSWTLEDDGGSNITEYQVQWKSGAQSFDSSRQQAGLTATNTRIENLINGTEYDVRVRAMNSAGWGEWSDIDSGTPVEGPAVSLSTETLTIDEGGSGAYSVVLTTEPTAPVSILISPEGDVTTQPNALVFTASNWNIWQKVTVNAAQDGDADDDTVTIHHHTNTFAQEYEELTDLPSVQVTVLDDDVPPPAVRGFIAVDESQDAIALSWWSERGAAEYELEYRKQGDTGAWTRVTRGDFDHLPSTTGNRSLTGIATGLECETTYDFRIRLRGSGDILLNAFGPHTEVSRTTGECAQPNKPTNLMYTLDPDCATLTWTAPTGGDYTGVRIRRLTHGDDNFTVIHESLNSRPTSYRDCTHTGDGYGDGDSPEYAYAITYIKRETRSFDNNAESKVHRSGLKQYGPAVQDHLHATPRNVLLTVDTDSQRRMTWEAPPSGSLTIERGLQGASVPVPDPWITGYVVERREFRARADGYLYFLEAEDTRIWSATMIAREGFRDGIVILGYRGGAFGSLSEDEFNHASGRYQVLELSHGGGSQNTPPTLELTIDGVTPPHVAEDWVLVIDGTDFPLADALVQYPIAGRTLITWNTSAIVWTNLQQVSVQMVDRRDRYGWERLRRGRDGDTSTSFTDDEQANGRKFVYRIMTANTLGVSTNRAIFDWLFDSPYRDAVVDLAATDTSTDDGGGGGGGGGETDTGNTGGESSNTPATGAPAISGTPQVGQTLTASTSAITDADGLTNAAFSYQWTAGGSDIAGATGSTHTLTASEQGQTVQVRVSFTDDADNEETLTSEATDEVTAAPVPLTASRPDSRFQSARHKGADDRPQVIVAFSMAVASFEKTTPSLSLTGAAVSSVRRHQEDGLDNAWIFFLDPDGSDDIVFSLVTGQPCDSGGICTEDGRTLSGGVQAVLPGPDEEGEPDNPEPDDPNSPATGEPVIGGTPQVGETLTADTANIVDQDGLTNASYSYQWIAGGSDIDGATGASYTLTPSEQGQTIQVRVTFTDDADNEETLTSEATAVVTAPPVPLTVSVTVSAPASHDGSSAFTFEIEFSEEFGLSYRTLKFDALNVTGGSVEKAQRTGKPSNIPWRIEIKPQGAGDVTIELPATTDCDAGGAICTGDGRKLSNPLSFTVTGPGQ